MHTFRYTHATEYPVIYVLNINAQYTTQKIFYTISYTESNTLFHHVNPGQQSGQILHSNLQERSDMLRGNGVLVWPTETKRLTSAGSKVVRKSLMHTVYMYSYCVFISYSVFISTCMCKMCFAVIHCLYSAFSGGFDLVDCHVLRQLA